MPETLGGSGVLVILLSLLGIVSRYGIGFLSTWFVTSVGAMFVTLSLIAIGFFIYGPVMLIGVQALDLAPKNAAGTSAGLTGFFAL